MDFSEIGAWWLGWIVLAVVMLLFAGLIGLFPMHLPKKKPENSMNARNVDEFEMDGERTHTQSSGIVATPDANENNRREKSKDEEVSLKSKF